MEATGGFEPPNRGFADPRLRPLGYVARCTGTGAEEETRTPTALAATAPSTLRVYQFHHLGSCTATYGPYSKQGMGCPAIISKSRERCPPQGTGGRSYPYWWTRSA